MPRSEAQIAGDRKRCLNGVCAMTDEERKIRKRKYKAEMMADPFRRKQYAAYFRKRRARPGMREKTNEQARTRYAADKEKSRAYCREKYRRMMADPVRHAEYLKRKAERRHGADGKQTAACKRAQIREKLIPRWERVVADGREEAYIRRTTEENARLFKMWLTNPVMFDEMIHASYKKSRTSL